jgi:FtsH-binding integral membrane protein
MSNGDTITFSRPEENTLGVIVGGSRRRTTTAARRLGRTASAHRASLGTAFLGLGAAIVVALRGVYGLTLFGTQWEEYPEPFPALAAWIVLAAILVGAIVLARVTGERMPTWVFAVFLLGLAVVAALDVYAIWELRDVGTHATAALEIGRAHV